MNAKQKVIHFLTNCENVSQIEYNEEIIKLSLLLRDEFLMTEEEAFKYINNKQKLILLENLFSI